MELRLGFAMGGGVSLGTFSGAALAETIKLAVLETCPGPGGAPPRYTRVVVDVFSGASAGAMSLGVMLRALATRTPAQEASARARLDQELGAAWIDGLPDDRRRDLVAAQVVVDLEEELWCRRVRLDGLLGGDDPSRLIHQAGVLDRSVIDGVARDVMRIPSPAPAFSATKRLLGKRVLFASTLANLTPAVIDARRQYGPGGPVLNDALRSLVHRDVRVFDLHFGDATGQDFADETRNPSRWVRYHEGPELGGRIGDLRAQRTWAKITATAVASGAFPLMFEPVVLRRHRYELGPDWPFGPGVEDYPFTYVDGGLFNNEPLREAFRLAAFLDSWEPASDAFKRVIVFVDPNVAADGVSYELPVHRQWSTATPSDGGSFQDATPRRRPSLERLLPHLATLGDAVFDEATVAEGDRAYRVRDTFAMRDTLRGLLADGSLSSAPPPASIEALLAYCQKVLSAERARELIPPGPMTVAGELRRIIREEPARLGALRDREDAFVDGTDRNDPTLWHLSLAWLMVDLLLDLGGKRADTILVAIAPIADPTASPPVLLDLPGGALAGFAGFLSDVPGPHEVLLARHCARAHLHHAGLISAPPAASLPELTSAQNHQIEQDVEAGAMRMAVRLEEMLRHSRLAEMIPFLGGAAISFIGRFLRQKLRGLAAGAAEAWPFEFHVGVPNDRFELAGNPELSAARTPSGWRLITIAEFLPATDTWRGPHVHAGRELKVDVDGLGPFPDEEQCRLLLPTRQQVEAARPLPCPRFVQSVQSTTKNVVGASVWQLEPGVQLLEDVLAR